MRRKNKNVVRKKLNGRQLPKEKPLYLILAALAVLAVMGGLFLSSDFTTATGQQIQITPTVSITSPPTGSKINNSVVVTTSSFGGVSKVRFLDVEDNVYSEDSTSPFSATWAQISQGLPTEGNSRTLKAIALDAGGAQVASAQITVTHQNNPDPPADLAAQSGDGFVYLTWSVPNYYGNANNIACYKIFRSTTANPSSSNSNLISSSDINGCKPTDPTGLSYNDTTATNGVSYYYDVKSVAPAACPSGYCIATTLYSDGSTDVQATPSSTPSSSTTTTLGGPTTTSSAATTTTLSGTTTTIASPTTTSRATTTSQTTTTASGPIQIASSATTTSITLLVGVTAEEALAAIQDANQTIISFQATKDVSEALPLYAKAIDFFNAANYAQAKSFALQSKAAIKESKPTEVPILFFSLGAILILIVIVGIVYVVQNRTKAGTTKKPEQPAAPVVLPPTSATKKLS